MSSATIPDTEARSGALRRRLARAGAATLLALIAGPGAAAAAPIPVTPDNFPRAESDLYFSGVVAEGGLGRFVHRRELPDIDNQTVVRLNRDTLSSSAVFDLDAGPVTITLPDAGRRFMSMQVIDEDQDTFEVVYRPGAYTLTRDKVGTRYAAAVVRLLVDPGDARDRAAVRRLQDGIRVAQPGGPGRFEIPGWDQASQKTVRDALLALASTLPDQRPLFDPPDSGPPTSGSSSPGSSSSGSADRSDPLRRLIGAASISAWGGNPEKDALALAITPPRNDGRTVYRLVVGEVPVDGFWSVSVYNDQGYFQPNPQQDYTVNSVTARTGADDTVTVQFGGCDGKAPNCLPITPGWTYLVRLYRPRPAALDGSWSFPEARPVGRPAPSRELSQPAPR